MIKIKQNKKGLAVGMVFIFIVAAITFALIMLFGYQAITDFTGSGEKVQFIQFKTDLETSIKKLYTEYGAIRKETYTTPVRYERVCFVDLDFEPSDVELSQLCAINAYACDVWQDAWVNPLNQGYAAVNENVFLTPAEATVPIKVFNIRIVDENGEKLGFVCSDIKRGSFSLTLEGKGDSTEISP